MSFCALMLLTVSALFLLAADRGRADSGSGALVVSTCGSVPKAFAAGSTRSITVNTQGQVCN